MNVKPFSFTPPPLPATIIPTGFMIEIENRFKSAFYQNGFLVWYGAAGAGKTTCGEWIGKRINTAFDAGNPLAFRALMYEAGKSSGHNAGKRALRTLYKKITGYQMYQRTYQFNDIEVVAEEVLHAIKRKRIGVLLIDEAGLMPLDAISAFTLLLDMAKSQNYHLTIVLIGMDDLPLKMDKNLRPQLHRRVCEWCNFKDYELEDTYNLLSGLHPYFKSLDRDKADELNQIRIVHELTGGLPGLIVNFLAKFDSTYKVIPDAINTTLLRGIHLNDVTEYQDIISAARGKKSSVKVALKEVKTNQ